MLTSKRLRLSGSRCVSSRVGRRVGQAGWRKEGGIPAGRSVCGEKRECVHVCVCNNSVEGSVMMWSCTNIVSCRDIVTAYWRVDLACLSSGSLLVNVISDASGCSNVFVITKLGFSNMIAGSVLSSTEGFSNSVLYCILQGNHRK